MNGNPAQKAGIALAVCAVLLLVAIVTKGWATASEGNDEVNAGLFSMEGCGRGRCESIGWGKAAERLDIPGDVKAFRIIGILGGFAALGALGLAAGMALAGNAHRIPRGLVHAALGVAGFGLAFYATRLWMADEDVNFGPSWGAFVGLGALIAAEVVIKTMLPRGAAPAVAAQAGYPAPPPPQAAPQLCPRCGQPIEFVAQYQRWFCRNENQYL